MTTYVKKKVIKQHVEYNGHVSTEKGLEAFHQSETGGYLKRYNSGCFHFFYTEHVLAFVIRKKIFLGRCYRSPDTVNSPYSW